LSGLRIKVSLLIELVEWLNLSHLHAAFSDEQLVGIRRTRFAMGDKSETFL
jgi:hypothetical protein